MSGVLPPTQKNRSSFGKPIRESILRSVSYTKVKDLTIKRPYDSTMCTTTFMCGKMSVKQTQKLCSCWFKVKKRKKVLIKIMYFSPWAASPSGLFHQRERRGEAESCILQQTQASPRHSFWASGLIVKTFSSSLINGNSTILIHGALWSI